METISAVWPFIESFGLPGALVIAVIYLARRLAEKDKIITDHLEDSVRATTDLASAMATLSERIKNR